MIRKDNLKRLLCILMAIIMCIGVMSGCRNKDDESGTTDDLTNSPDPLASDEPYSIEQEQERFDLFMDEIFADIVTSDSITLNYFVANPARYGIELGAPTYGQVTTQESIADDREETREFIDRLNGFRYADLRTDQQIIYDALAWSLDLIVALDGDDDYPYYMGEVYPVSGIQAQLPVLLAEFNYRTHDDIEAYLGLLGDTLRYFGELIEFERERSRRGYFMSIANTDTVIEYCESFLENREDNMLIGVFNEKIDRIEGLSQGERDEFKQRNRDLVLNDFLPAYEMLVEAMRELRGQGANRDGLAALPDGKAYAALYLRYITGSEMTPEEVEALLRERIYHHWDYIVDVINNDPVIYDRYVNNTLGDMQDEIPGIYLRMLEKRMIYDFPAIDPVRYVVNEVQESLSEYLSPAFFLTPAVDNYVDNVIYVNPGKISDNLSLFTTLAHEGYPGHMYQRVFTMQQTPHPLRLMIGTTGYSEGWATYVEMRSFYYAGLDDVEATVMQYMQMYYLMLYALTDLGVNALDWGLTGAAAFLGDFGFSDSETLSAIYNAVTADPLSYLPYCLGSIEFEFLREEAEDLLRERFDPVEFHRFILELGSAPFPLIRVHMFDWINSQSSAALAPAA